MIRMLKRFIVACLVIAFAVTLWSAWWLLVKRNIAPVSVFIESGEPLYKAVVKLRDGHVINSPWLFSKAAILAGIDRHIIPGRYDFQGRLSNYDVMHKLLRGDVAILTVTIPEGYNLQQISRILNQKCGVNRRVFDSLSRDSVYLAGLGIKTGFAEGYLFPATYNFPWGIPAGDAFGEMAGALFSRLTDSIMIRATSLGYTVHDLLTMASIIESESKAEDELGKIASVYTNRYKIGMRLQADPTIIYGMGGLNRHLTTDDYKFPSRYNTYLYKGFPPTPICSPGMKSIMAALYPDSTNYLYFVADGNGRHVFNRSYEQHLKDIYRIKRELRKKALLLHNGS